MGSPIEDVAEAIRQYNEALRQYNEALLAGVRAEAHKETARRYAEHKIREAVRAGVPFDEIIDQHDYARAMLVCVLDGWRREVGDA
jgi:hypothetical protein